MARFRIYLPTADIKTVLVKTEAPNALVASDRANTSKLGLEIAALPQRRMLKAIADLVVQASRRVAR